MYIKDYKNYRPIYLNEDGIQFFNEDNDLTVKYNYKKPEIYNIITLFYKKVYEYYNYRTEHISNILGKGIIFLSGKLQLITYCKKNVKSIYKIDKKTNTREINEKVFSSLIFLISKDMQSYYPNTYKAIVKMINTAGGNSRKQLIKVDLNDYLIHPSVIESFTIKLPKLEE